MAHLIVNTRTKQPVLRQYLLCRGVFSKARGLMFSRNRTGYGLIFAFRKPVYASLHMWFVFYSIDVLFLDRNKRIVEIKRNLKPFWGYIPQNRATYVIEGGTGYAVGCTVGDVLNF